VPTVQIALLEQGKDKRDEKGEIHWKRGGGGGYK